jgi:hypothetical protein
VLDATFCAGASSLEQANAYLEQDFLPWWNHTLTVEPNNPCDAADRPGTQEYDLAAILSHVETRQISNGYTVQYGGQTYQIPASQLRPGMRWSQLRVEVRLDGAIAMRFEKEYLGVEVCELPLRAAEPKRLAKPRAAPRKSRWMQGFLDKPGLPLGKVIAIANATS